MKKINHVSNNIDLSKNFRIQKRAKEIFREFIDLMKKDNLRKIIIFIHRSKGWC